MAWLKKSVDGHDAVSDGLGGFDFNLTMKLSSDMRIGSSSTSPYSAGCPVFYRREEVHWYVRPRGLER